jgi:hypothetical protein
LINGKIAFLPLKFAEFAEKPNFFPYLQKYPNFVQSFGDDEARLFLQTLTLISMNVNAPIPSKTPSIYRVYDSNANYA